MRVDPHGEERGTRVSNHEGLASFEMRHAPLLRMRPENKKPGHIGPGFET
jgi:hypothetical protein